LRGQAARAGTLSPGPYSPQPLCPYTRIHTHTCTRTCTFFWGLLQERHADELRDFQQKLVAAATTTRHSKEYYNLREIQEKLAHNKNYAAAAKIKEKADELMAFEEEKCGNERHKEMLHKENVFKSRLAMEADALRKRVAQGRAEQNRARQIALEKMLQRYYNSKAEMEQSHRLGVAKFERETAQKKAGGGKK
jgi:hypothetical protein